MDFNYFVFLVVILTIKKYLNRLAKKKKKYEKLPDGVIKAAYEYAPSTNKKLLRECNIYTLENTDTRKMPIIIDIHGGCWVHGDKDVYDEYNSHLVKEGNVVSSLTYRTADKASLGDQIRDVFAYLNFLEENADELKISLDQVMLTGDSAGAELALVCHCINQSEEMQRVFKVKPIHFDIQAMVLTHPVCFIDQAGTIPQSQFLSKHFGVPGLQRFLYGKNYHESEEYQYSVNPTKFIDENMTFPPILLVTSEGDSTFKYQTFLLADLFDSCKIDYRIYFEQSKDAPHVFNISKPLDRLALKCNQYINDFFHTSLLSQ
ncbi:alpha/beta hydrolase [Ileibacterium valens]|uniref:BD-FAE-like domain-containing protein n=1 Tax=Ileibacterium valens TaxID=1862668 RepID=A0A1U7NGA6_9FIRM|nr:alpha/beta hydrolase [Ileibacterium valens]OLU39946.1 hypothetical protein BO222_05865 [Ileibacterium valens]OLU41749.1 hypothetical protein BO224_03035 [Erysipelotrichaceae bacterium NYU-BL-E8]OLU43201.1 hypothetical protein BM735_00810 [Erysipelotrichaceae bacterium NYU-BL-F16]